MTFSIVGQCRRTNMVGVAITTSSICVASRCPWVRAGVGAVATQNVTDPSLGPLLLDYMQAGLTPLEAMDRVTTGRQNIEFRQLTAVDVQGGIAHHTGLEILGSNAVYEGEQCLAAGNLLANTSVPEAMAIQFSNGSDLHLAERLILALQAGVDVATQFWNSSIYGAPINPKLPIIRPAHSTPLQRQATVFPETIDDI